MEISETEISTRRETSKSNILQPETTIKEDFQKTLEAFRNLEKNTNTIKEHVSTQVKSILDIIDPTGIMQETRAKTQALMQDILMYGEDVIQHTKSLGTNAQKTLNNTVEPILNTLSDTADTIKNTYQKNTDISKSTELLIQSGKNLADFIGKIPKSTYENMKLALQNIQKLSGVTSHIKNISSSLGIDPYLICGICTQETKFNAGAVSPKGARGLMQLMPTTEAGIKRFIETGKTKYAGPEEKFYAELRNNQEFMKMYRSKDPILQNLAIGSAFVKFLGQKYGGNTEALLRYYNGGSSVASRNSAENQSYAPGTLGYTKIFREMKIFG